jgi:hypothetical protein
VLSGGGLLGVGWERRPDSVSGLRLGASATGGFLFPIDAPCVADAVFRVG